MSKVSIQLGDGAHVTLDNGGSIYPMILTANHHDPDQATDRVAVDERGVLNLFDLLAKTWPARETNRHGGQAKRDGQFAGYRSFEKLDRRQRS